MAEYHNRSFIIFSHAVYCKLFCDVLYVSPPADPLVRKAEEANDSSNGAPKPLRGVLELPEGVFAKAQRDILTDDKYFFYLFLFCCCFSLVLV